MARKQQDNTPAPAAQPAYKVVKREKDRWWEVRDPQDELVCVTSTSVARSRWCGGSQRDGEILDCSSRGGVRRGCCAVPRQPSNWAITALSGLCARILYFSAR